MDKTYRPAAIEARYYQHWEQSGYFAPKGSGAPYCIMLPPPNVTGSLHMGHAFQQTLMDILIRYHRMQGDDTLWQCGTDHAGIATQMVVERRLQRQAVSRHDLGREKFVEAVWDWKAHSGNIISRQSRRLGTSMDWSRECFTMDAHLSAAVKEVFVRLYEEGLIYRGKRLVNWDPTLHTAISDLEVIATEESGHLWHLRYPLTEPAAGLDHLIVATTRPETMLGDAAVAVHPEDERYRDLVGREVRLPLCERGIPVIADDYVKPEFGSGCVKITPAHDFNDYAVGERHRLQQINIFTPEAAINERAPAQYRGLDRYAARRRIVADLKALGLVERIEDHRLMVPRGDRSGAVIEPYLTDQWHVRIQSLAEPAIKAVREGQIKFVPEHWSKTYFEWMGNIQDWCISRQLWWGHRIPAWYDAEGNIYVGRDEAEVRKNHALGDMALRQDEDVLDTWFSSALWPFSTLGWPDRTPELDKYYPTSVLVTGFDIIFFWVARMIMLGLKFTGRAPFREVYITGLIRDAAGQKMSKSKGNVLDPIDLIDGIGAAPLLEKLTRGLMQPQLAPKIEAATRKHFPDGIAAHGADALRFTFAALATQGRDIRFDTGRIEGNRNFCNKLWNAARYVLLKVESEAPDITQGERQCAPAERWICARLADLIEAAHEGIGAYRFDLAAKALYEFIRDEYCDWYLELSKITLGAEEIGPARKRAALYTLLNVMEILLRALHPFMPFITEALWQRLAPALNKKGASIMLAGYPQSAELARDPAAVRQIEWLKLFVMGVRRIRAERDLPPGRRLTVYTRAGRPEERAWLLANQRHIKGLAKIAALRDATGEMDDAAMALAGDMTLLVALTDIIDPGAESGRLQKEIEKREKEKAGLRGRLANTHFVERAPAGVVEATRRRLADAESDIATYRQQLAVITRHLSD